MDFHPDLKAHCVATTYSGKKPRLMSSSIYSEPPSRSDRNELQSLGGEYLLRKLRGSFIITFPGDILVDAEEYAAN